MRLLVALAAMLTLYCPSTLAQEQAVAAPKTDAVTQRLADYLDTFNSGDAAAVGAFWSADAVSLDEESGERSTGRDAIVAEFKEFFAESPGARLTGSVGSVRSPGPGVAIAEGTVSLFTPDSEPSQSAFTAVLVQEDGRWLIESSYERDLPSPTSQAALQELGWLIGQWHDDSEEVDVNTTVRWSPNEAFLIRSFHADYKDGESFQGTQIIGWDPSAKQYRTWTFNSDGSFGEGTLSRKGDQWLVRMSYVRGDGSTSAGTQVIEPVDENTLRVSRIGQTANGTPAPAGDPVTVVRVDTEAAAAPSGGSPQ